MIGQTISHYRVTEKLGEGGMGIVYKAEDTQLRIPVALKFLSRDVLGDEEVENRLIREAQTAAALDHPNICRVYGVHREDEQTFIAMAFVDGPSLDARIKQRRVPLDEALDIAVQAGEGLQEAHEAGVVHRDIKPQNIMLTAKGQVKIMDFGLAQLSGRSRLTKPGTTLGTRPYMAPEQLLGEETDRRADIWALGVVLYEMLAQRLPFEADYDQAIAYAILNEEPEVLTAQRGDLPLDLDRVISKALTKDPTERYQHVEDMLVDLRRLKKRSGARRSVPSIKAAPLRDPAPGPQAKGKQLALMAVLVLASLIFGLLLQRYAFPGPNADRPVRQLRRYSIQPPAEVVRLRGPGRMVSISPDGRYIAYVTLPATGRSGLRALLWVHDLQRDEPRLIKGVDYPKSPFWSPDSEFILVGSQAPKGVRLLSVPVQGGTPITVCDIKVGHFRQGSMSTDGKTIVFHAGSPGQAWTVPFGGGTPEPVLSRDEIEDVLTEYSSAGTEVGNFPQFLPSEGRQRGLVFGVSSRFHMLVMDLSTRQRHALQPRGRSVFYSPSGHLLYVRGTDLWALPFSVSRLEAEGQPFRVRERVVYPTVSRDGTLVYFEAVHNPRQLIWRGRDGEELGSIGDGSAGRISPDGSKVVLAAGDPRDAAIFVHDLDRGTRSQVTHWDEPERTLMPVWSPDGKQIAFTSSRGDDAHIYLQQVDGTGDALPLLSEPGRDFPFDWSRNGKYIMFNRNNPEMGGVDLFYAERDERNGEWTPKPLRKTQFGESNGKFSPDGRHYAYLSNETGQDEIIVREFPDGEDRWVVSRGNKAGRPCWSADGGELYYVAGGTLFAVPVSTELTFSHEKPAALFQLAPGSFFDDVSADGRRFLFSEPSTERREAMIRVVENWYEEFRERQEH